MNLRLVVLNDYNSQNEIIAKKLPIIKEEILSAKSNILDLCDEISRLEYLEEFESAAELLSQSWQGYKVLPLIENLDLPEQAEMLLRIGSVASNLGFHKQIAEFQQFSLETLQRALVLFKSLRNDEGISKTLNKTGVAFWRCNQLDKAKKYFLKASGSAQTKESKATALANLAAVTEISKDYQSAEKILKSLRSLFGQISQRTEANIRNTGGIIYKQIALRSDNKTRLDYFDKSIMEYQSALMLYEEIHNQKSVASTRNNIGNLFLVIEDYYEARNYLETAKTDLFRLKQWAFFASACDSLLKVYLAIGNTSIAVENGKTALKYTTDEPSHIRYAFILNYALALAANGDTSEAKEMFSIAFENASKSDDLTLKVKVRLFELNKLFDTFDRAERLEIYQNAANLFSDSQDTEITKTLEEIKEKLNSPSEAVDSVQPEWFSLDSATLEFRHRYISEAFAKTGNNLSKAAKLLGMERRELSLEIKNKYPDLEELKNSAGRPVENKNVFFPSYSVTIKKEYAEADLVRIRLNKKFSKYKPGDYLLFSLGIYETNKIVLIEIFNQKVFGFLRKSADELFLDYETGQFPIDDLNMITGQAVAVVKAAEYSKYIEQREAGVDSEMPYREIT